jgi:hypothetical protein
MLRFRAPSAGKRLFCRQHLLTPVSVISSSLFFLDAYQITIADDWTRVMLEVILRAK